MFRILPFLFALILLAVFGADPSCAARPDTSPDPAAPVSGTGENQGNTTAMPGKPYTGQGICAVVPEGWKVATDKDAVLFTSATEGKEKPAFVRASVLKLKSDDHKEFLTFCESRAKQLGGGNVRETEGGMEFSMGRDTTGIFNRYGGRCLFLIVNGDSNEVTELMLSITPEE